MIPAVGEMFAGYSIERPLGRGGMGAVYLARHQRLRRNVALKILLPQYAEDADFRKRFLEESRMAASLEHPSVITIFDSDEIDGTLFISMRYVEGGDLKERLAERGPLSLEETIAIIEQIGSALDAAHAVDLIHRDVKPANILLSGEGDQAFLSDFGVAKRTTSGGMTTRGFLGTVDYCSPEQINGDTLDGRADIYSLGCVAYQCLVGQTPFPRETEIAVAHAHVHEPVPALSTARSGLPPAFDGVIATAMAKYPSVRYRTGAEFASALRSESHPDPDTLTDQLLNGARAHAAPPVTEPTIADWRESPRISQTTPIPDPPPAAEVKKSKKGWLIGAGIAVIVVTASAAAGVILLNQGSKTSTPPPATPPVTTPARKQPAKQAPPILESVIAARMSTELVPAQQIVGLDLRSLDASRASFSHMHASANALDNRVLQTQGWLTSLDPKSSSDRAMVTALSAALVAQAGYAQSLLDLPAVPTALTKSEARRAYDEATNAEDAYVRLSGVAPKLPAMPIRQRDSQQLLNVVPKPRPHPHPAQTTPPVTPVAPSGAGSSNDVSAIESTISGHWADVNAGDYEGAYDYFAPSLQSASARSSWVDDKDSDRPTSSAIDFTNVVVSGASAEAYVRFSTVGQEVSAGDNGCNTWSGYYSMIEDGGSWYIEASHLTPTRGTC